METKNEEKVYDALEISDYLIYLAMIESGEGEQREKSLPDGDNITHTKLQKMLYFAQAHFLGVLDRPLFSNDIYAWTYGPVVEEVYAEYKDKKYELLFPPEDKTNASDFDNISDFDQAVIEGVWDVYGRYSARYLTDLSHEHKPWKEAYANKNSKIIPQKRLKSYYSQILD